MLYLDNFFNIIFTPFEKADPVWPILIISFITGILIMSVFRLTLNSGKIKYAKNRIMAHLLEIPLYKDNIRILLSAQKNMLIYNFKFLLSIFKPVLIVIIPMSLCVFQMQKWFGYEPLKPGTNTVFNVMLDDKKALNNISIEAGNGLGIDTPVLRIPEENKVYWRISASKPGKQYIKINTGEQILQKDIIVSEKKLIKLIPEINLRSYLYKFLYAENKSVTADSHIKQIKVDYKSRTINFLGMEMHWLVLFCILTIVFGLVFKKLLGVKFG